MTPEQLIASVAAAVDNPDAARGPEVVSVHVLTTDPEIARLLGPGIAARLWPSHRYGRVLHVEADPLPDGREAVEVLVEVIR